METPSPGAAPDKPTSSPRVTGWESSSRPRDPVRHDSGAYLQMGLRSTWPANKFQPRRRISEASCHNWRIQADSRSAGLSSSDGATTLEEDT